MSSPIPPDPYVALGVNKDADISTIRSAHRKLVLKHHPDRIQDPALKEKGKDEFQKIQQAYELLSDPVKRSRYDDKIKLAELRRDTMMNGGSTRSYPVRPAPPPSSTGREYREDDRTFYEERRPRDTRDPRDYRDARDPRDMRDSYFDNRDRFDEPIRTSSRKYDDYERKTTPKAAEKERTARTPKANWATAFTAVNVGTRMKREVESRKAKANVDRQETRDREKRKARMDKEQQTRNPYVVSEGDSDSDTATRVTSSTIRPTRSSPRQNRMPEPSSKRSSRNFSFSEDESDGTSYASRKWESHHETSKEYIERASGGRPGPTRSESGSFWHQTSRKSGSDGERRPTSSKGRHSYDDPPPRPSMPTHTSAPSGLKNRVNERNPAQRRSATGSYPTRDREREVESRQEMPGFHRSKTMPASRPISKKDNAPSKSSGLKETHTHTQDSGYGSSSSPHTPELREESPGRRPPMQRSTRYAIVDPSSDDDRASRLKKVLDDDSDHRRRRYQQSPEPDRREPDRRKEKTDRPDRPRLDTRMRSKTTRDISGDMPSIRRAESARYDARSPKQSPTVSRHNSSREKFFGEISPDERESSGYKYPVGDRINVRPQFQEARYSNYGRDSPDRRAYDYAPSSKFHDSIRSERRASVQGHG